MKNKPMSRRQFLRYLGYGGLFLTGGQLISACQPFSTPQPTPVVQGDPDVEIRLVAKPGEQQIFPGTPTQVWRFHGEVIQGPPDAIITLPDTYLGPIFNLQKGAHLRVHFENELPEVSIVHWHGLHVPQEADGHPRFVIQTGETYTYDFKIMDRAGTYWYHPHPHGRTGPQVYAGMAGLFLIHDDAESALDLPTGENDQLLVIQDRSFDEQNQLVYNTVGMMNQIVGMLGDQIFVNGKPDYVLEADRGAYRLRLLNGSNSRIYKLAWEDGTPLQVIGTDGGLLEEPQIRDYVTLAPAQRVELWVDFDAWDAGQTVKMVNLPSSAPDGGQKFSIFTAEIQNNSGTTRALPENFPVHEKLDLAQAVNAGNPRVFALQMGMGMAWTINDRQFEMTDVADNEKVQLGDVEIWEFVNQGGGGMGMGMAGVSQPHPMHIHGLQFKIIDRQIDSDEREAYQTLQEGFVDEGWHDTVLVMPGERVRVLMKFSDYAGLYVYHCHNLEHEDMGMMRNYRVQNG